MLPVPIADVEAVKSHVSRLIWALIRLQLYTGARGGELVMLRPIDIDMSREDVWVVSPEDHKTAYVGRKRMIYFGPKAKTLVKQFLVDRSVTAFLFSPQEAESERHAACSGHRRANQPRSPRKTDRELGEHYTTHLIVAPSRGRAKELGRQSGHRTVYATMPPRRYVKSSAWKPRKSF